MTCDRLATNARQPGPSCVMCSWQRHAMRPGGGGRAKLDPPRAGPAPLPARTGAARTVLARTGAGLRPSTVTSPTALLTAPLRAITVELVRYRAHARFTTWAYKYVMFGLSEAAGRRFWSGQPWPKEYDWRLLTALRPAELPASSREWRETLAAVRRAMDLELAGSQRAIFAAVTLGHLPPEALTCGLGPDRNAIYRALFEARRRVGSRLAADGFLQADDVLRQTASRLGWLRPLVAADPGDTGCDVAFQALDRYAEAELEGSDPRSHFPGVGAHLLGCGPCGQDYQGLLAAARPSEPSPGCGATCLMRTDAIVQPGR